MIRVYRKNSFAIWAACALVALQAGCGQKAAAPTPPARPVVDVASVRAKAEAGDPQAQAQLGKLYVKGEGVTNSYKEAAKWFQMAAEKGNADAQAGLAELYDAGRGVPKDMDAALKLYRQAAAAGSSAAQYTLGFLYERGKGVPQDQNEAAKWYKLAAEGGEPIAQFDTGQRYELGVGAKVDCVEALKWFTLAAAQGQQDSIKRADQIKSKMSSEEIGEAKRRVAAFRPRSSAQP